VKSVCFNKHVDFTLRDEKGNTLKVFHFEKGVRYEVENQIADTPFIISQALNIVDIPEVAKAEAPAIEEKPVRTKRKYTRRAKSNGSNDNCGV
jgi:hypothetical protein